MFHTSFSFVHTLKMKPDFFWRNVNERVTLVQTSSRHFLLVVEKVAYEQIEALVLRMVVLKKTYCSVDLQRLITAA